MPIMEEITIKSRIKDFKVIFTDNFQFIDRLTNIPQSVVIAGQTVYRHYREKIFSKFSPAKLIVMKLDEENKTLETVVNLYRRLLKFPFKKNLTVISFGGGINQDVVGFTASTLYRGVHWIYIPTTLLSQADSCIGSKTSLNFASSKNIIGTFYPPEKVYINPDFIDTLEDQYYLSGLGEMIKLLLMDTDSIGKLNVIVQTTGELIQKKNKKIMLDTIKRCLKIKQKFMEGDEFDQGRRNLLNYGHELGHALEPVSNYKIPHGIAVVFGMMFANIVSLRRGLLTQPIFDLVNNKIFSPVIYAKSVRIKNNYFDKDAILSKIKQDKKRVGKDLVMVIPDRNLVFEKIMDYSEGEFEKDYRELMGNLK